MFCCGFGSTLVISTNRHDGEAVLPYYSTDIAFTAVVELRTDINKRFYFLGGIVLTASHNPGGIRNDFGIKYNIENGGPAPDQLTDEIYSLTQKITQYKFTPELDCDFLQPGVQTFEVITDLAWFLFM